MEKNKTEWVEFNKKNSKGEKLAISITHCEAVMNDNGSVSKHAVSYYWFQNGFTKKLLKSYLSVKTYVYDESDNCCISMKYNPQKTIVKKQNMIDFDWLLEDTEANKKRLIDETLKRFYA